ncbi:sugar phosphate isomerase/epimerase [Friedmanniella endophytica]|uniref:Sugar phosphate isomerase/epimerase n=1 Tax=Microlunatus kandeliicorticis TaxID=1759536 RepID=A0A7W3P4S3_9ACTN|nr:sugar phosphate isomerase/epimerase [Microlunatus kandeliicorticis]MBA8793137.1 sugar phosphate isomerase/epimerase [Microlunatus kandeliicorticis]
MADLGVMTTEFAGDLETVLDAVVAHGFTNVQLQLGSTAPDVPVRDALLRGLEVLGGRIGADTAHRVRAATAARGLRVAAVDGTYNMAHPDPASREANLERLLALIAHAQAFGTDLVTLCTGTRAELMWTHHEDNRSPAAWDDVVGQLRRAAPAAEAAGVRLAFEPEHNNVVDTAARAEALIEQVGSPALGVVMDPANLFHRGDLARQRDHLAEAFARLGPYVLLAHAKDLDHDGDAGGRAAGCGHLDYDAVLAELAAAGFDGTIVLHQLAELAPDRIGEAVDHVRRHAPEGYLR